MIIASRFSKKLTMNVIFNILLYAKEMQIGRIVELAQLTINLPFPFPFNFVETKSYRKELDKGDIEMGNNYH